MAMPLRVLLASCTLVAVSAVHIRFPANNSILDTEKIELSLWVPSNEMRTITNRSAVEVCVGLNDEVRLSLNCR